MIEGGIRGATLGASPNRAYATQAVPPAEPDHARLQNMLEALFVVRGTTAEQLARLRNSMDFVLGAEPEASCTDGLKQSSPYGMAEQIREVFLQIGTNLSAINYQLARLERVAS